MRHSIRSCYRKAIVREAFSSEHTGIYQVQQVQIWSNPSEEVSPSALYISNHASGKMWKKVRQWFHWCVNQHYPEGTETRGPTAWTDLPIGGSHWGLKFGRGMRNLPFSVATKRPKDPHVGSSLMGRTMNSSLEAMILYREAFIFPISRKQSPSTSWKWNSNSQSKNEGTYLILSLNRMVRFETGVHKFSR
jgi:hypothetical protein